MPKNALIREFPYDLPLPRALWMLLAVLEGTVCLCLFWYVTLVAFLMLGQVRGHMEYTCALSTWVAFAAFWLYPLALLMTGARHLFAAARYLLAGLAGLCLLASAANLVTWCLHPAPIMAPQDFLGGGGYEVALHLAVLPTLLPGLGCLLRAWGGRRYEHCFYLASLIRSWHMGRRAFCIQAGLLALYAGVFLLFLCMMYAQAS